MDGLGGFLKTLKERIESPILNDSQKMQSCRLSLPLESLHTNNVDVLKKITLDSSKKKDLLASYISSVLGHFASNPSNKGNVEALSTIYAFEKENDKQDENHTRIKIFEDVRHTINDSKVSTMQFLSEVYRLAREYRDYYKEKTENGNRVNQDIASKKFNLNFLCKMFMIGKKGVGKTIFLNYLMSAFINNHDSEKVIWVRIDLTKKNHDNLQVQLRSKLCQIICTYYDVDTKWIKKFKVNISTKNPALKARFLKYNKTLLDDSTFEKKLSEQKSRSLETITKGIESWFFRGIYDHLALDHDVSFIFAIDGLDQLDLTEERKKEFDQNCIELKKYILVEDADPGVYLIAMRNESFSEYAGDPYRKPPILLIQATHPEKIYEKRINYLLSKQKLEELSKNNLELLPFSNDEDRKNFIKCLCEEFIWFVANSINDRFENRDLSNLKDCFDLLLGYFNENNRHLFYSLRYAFLCMMYNIAEYLIDDLITDLSKRITNPNFASKLKSRNYLAIEGFLLAGHYYNLPKYRYKFDSKTKKFIKKRLKMTNMSYIPNIFNHPFVTGTPKQLSVFCCTRILQYVSFNGGSCKKEDIIKFLSNYFWYEDFFICNLLTELQGKGLFYIKEPLFYEDPYNLSLSNLGSFILEKLIMNIEYVNLCMQATPLPEDLIDQGYFKPTALRSKDYVISKIKNSIDFVRLLVETESEEEKYFNKMAQKGNVNFSFQTYKDNSFLISESIRSGIKKDIETIVIGEERRDSDLKKELYKIFGL